MVDQRAHAATDGTPVAARLIRPRGCRARSADDRGIRPGYAGHRRHRLAFHFSDTSAVLQRVGDPAGGSVRRGPLVQFITRDDDGSALAHMLKENDDTSGLLPDYHGRLHNHLKRVLEFVIDNMPNLKAIVCLGNRAYSAVSACASTPSPAALLVKRHCARSNSFRHFPSS